MSDHSLRSRIATAVTEALRPRPDVLAGWEGGSAAFGAVDAYSDIDLGYLVADDVPFERLYEVAERALQTVSEIVGSHTPLKGRYVEAFGRTPTYASLPRAMGFRGALSRSRSSAGCVCAVSRLGVRQGSRRP
jgi:hypothetical protein